MFWLQLDTTVSLPSPCSLLSLYGRDLTGLLYPAQPGSPISHSLGYPLLSSPYLTWEWGDAVKLQTCSRDVTPVWRFSVHPDLQTLLGGLVTAESDSAVTTCCSPADSSSVQLNSRLGFVIALTGAKSSQVSRNCHYWGPDWGDEMRASVKLNYRPETSTWRQGLQFGKLTQISLRLICPARTIHIDIYISVRTGPVCDLLLLRSTLLWDLEVSLSILRGMLRSTLASL